FRLFLCLSRAVRPAVGQPLAVVAPTDGQASAVSETKSPSGSVSRASPRPSASRSAWSGLGAWGQLSTLSSTPSPSESQVAKGKVIVRLRTVPTTAGDQLLSQMVQVPLAGTPSSAVAGVLGR